jgi:hypothetical protein
MLMKEKVNCRGANYFALTTKSVSKAPATTVEFSHHSGWHHSQGRDDSEGWRWRWRRRRRRRRRRRGGGGGGGGEGGGRAGGRTSESTDSRRYKRRVRAYKRAAYFWPLIAKRGRKSVVERAEGVARASRPKLGNGKYPGRSSEDPDLERLARSPPAGYNAIHYRAR